MMFYMPFYKCSVLISKLKDLYSYEDVLKSALLVIIVTYIGQWPPTVPLKFYNIINNYKIYDTVNCLQSFCHLVI